MTSIQLNAELYKEMGKIADDEKLLTKVLKYVKKLAAKREDEQQMTHEALLAKLAKGESEYEQGHYYEMLPNEDLDDFLKRIG